MIFHKHFSLSLKNVWLLFTPHASFFGIPDGGLIFTELLLFTPEMLDTCSADRMQHLIKRLAGSPELGYEDYLRSETSLNDLEPRQMSILTNRLLSLIDFGDARARRNENFQILHKVLGSTNLLQLDAEPNGPLCYPYFSLTVGLRKKLLSQRVFVPTYWDDVLPRINGDCLELDLVNSILPIPCDQRYSSKDMTQVLSSI